MSPYYEHAGITIFLGDARDVVPRLGAFDLLLTDPPYPGYEKGWDIPDVPLVLLAIQRRAAVVFWPPMVALPLEPAAVDVWHKPNGNSAHHYELIIRAGETGRGCKVHRVAAILPNYAQYAAEAVDHPTQKPIKLVRRLLADHKFATSVVDPFMGSGTTLRAAKDLGVRAVGIEINERFAEIAARRLAQEVLFA
jgi:site-specific DNA-methyltransferase (adenine-specific)